MASDLLSRQTVTRRDTTFAETSRTGIGLENEQLFSTIVNGTTRRKHNFGKQCECPV